VDVAHGVSSKSMEPYETHFHDEVCAVCNLRKTRHCPCPLDYLLPLAVEAVEAVDQRRRISATG
jgi:hypothetical protein